MRYATLSTIIVALLVAGGSTSLAGETEHQVITDALVIQEYETGTIEVAEAVLADLVDIYLDTEPGSYCEVYASASVVVAQGLLDGLHIRDEDDYWTPEIGARWRVVFDVISPEMPAIAQRCLNEK